MRGGESKRSLEDGNRRSRRPKYDPTQLHFLAHSLASSFVALGGQRCRRHDTRFSRSRTVARWEAAVSCAREAQRRHAQKGKQCRKAIVQSQSLRILPRFPSPVRDARVAVVVRRSTPRGEKMVSRSIDARVRALDRPPIDDTPFPPSPSSLPTSLEHRRILFYSHWSSLL